MKSTTPSTTSTTQTASYSTDATLPERYNPSEQYARMTEVPRRIHILGTGSVGKLIAHSLRGIANPPPITLLFHRYKLLKAWRKSSREIILETDGYTVPRSGFDVELAVPKARKHGQPEEEEQESSESYPEDTTTSEAENQEEPIHNLIVTVKAGQTISALSAVKQRLLPTSTICFLQNGMGVIDDVNAALFPDPEQRPNYMQGIITHGVNQPSATLNPFTAIHAGHGTIALGILQREESGMDITRSVPFAQTSRYLLRTLTRTPVLAAVGMPPADLLQQQLEKLAVNAVVNPLTVLLDAPNGSILYNYALTRTMRLLLAEISLVLRNLPELRGLPNAATRFSPDRLETLVVSVANSTGKNISSMLADVRAGRQTEIRWINGYVVKRGEEMGTQCVCNYMMMQLVEGKHNMIERELADQVATKVDLSGER